MCSVASRREDKALAELLAKIHEDDMDDLCKSRGQSHRTNYCSIQTHCMSGAGPCSLPHVCRAPTATQPTQRQVCTVYFDPGNYLLLDKTYSPEYGPVD